MLAAQISIHNLKPNELDSYYDYLKKCGLDILLISCVSRNINQIAKRINATDNIYAEDMKQIKQTQEEIWQLLKSIELRLL